MSERIAWFHAFSGIAAAFARVSASYEHILSGPSSKGTVASVTITGTAAQINTALADRAPRHRWHGMSSPRPNHSVDL